MTIPVEIVEADLHNHEHQRDIVELIDAYAMDPMGGGEPLPEEVRSNLISGLQQHPTTIILLACQGSKAIGIAVCFTGFSTFNARPLLNLHDLAVLPAYRGTGVGRMLLDGTVRKARELGCCKLTLEVLEGNHRARTLYETAGFSQLKYNAMEGGARFYTRPV